MKPPLEGTRVIDFTTLLPGPLATLILVEAGAEVIKVERPAGGDEMRSYEPKFGDASVNFALLNRGKQSIAVDLKKPSGVRQIRSLVTSADVIVEQFRPGVMSRLGLGYDDVRRMNPRLVYCSITGYGQTGSRAQEAGHDLNYVSRAGLLSLVGDTDGNAILPPALIADIGGGAYPAVINILLALKHRDDVSGEGMHLDIAMAENVFPFLYWALGSGQAADHWPERGSDLLTGGSPRYGLYRTSDGHFVAVAALEDRFWTPLCDILGLSPDERRDAEDPACTQRAIAERISAHDAAYWRECLESSDVCCSVAATLREAVSDPHFAERGVFARTVADGQRTIPALPIPVADNLRRQDVTLGYPPLGNANTRLSAAN